ncbi:MAG: hypothetical protein FWG26_10305 [Betaproteobacteria bacterium]|nr:hypothetical protein [Betaproteobacteria bacterium]
MKHLSAALVIFALATPLTASASERLFLQIPAKLDPSAPIPTAVKNECALEMLLGNYALSAINQRIGSVQSVSAPEQAGIDKIVQLTIISAYGAGGGGWSGSKSASIRVDISKEGTIVGSTVLTRSSKGVVGMYGGTCALFDRIARALGKDVAVWLSRESAAQPTQPASKVAESSDEPESATE